MHAFVGGGAIIILLIDWQLSAYETNVYSVLSPAPQKHETNVYKSLTSLTRRKGYYTYCKLLADKICSALRSVQHGCLLQLIRSSRQFTHDPLRAAASNLLWENISVMVIVMLYGCKVMKVWLTEQHALFCGSNYN